VSFINWVYEVRNGEVKDEITWMKREREKRTSQPNPRDFL